MKTKTSCRAFLLSVEPKSFKDKETGKVVEYSDVKFAVEADNGGIEIITFRPKSFEHQNPVYKDLESGSLKYGDLIYEWKYSTFTNGYKPFLIEFKLN